MIVQYLLGPAATKSLGFTDRLFVTWLDIQFVRDYHLSLELDISYSYVTRLFTIFTCQTNVLNEYIKLRKNR